MAKENPAIKPRRQLTFGQWLLVLVFIITPIVLFGLYRAGIISLPIVTCNIGFQNTKNLNPNEMRMGVPYTLDFSSDLIPFLPPESTGGPYTFYLGSAVGSLPKGLNLGVDGVLSGAPTTLGISEYQVCIKDVGGKSACKTYHITVIPGTNVSPKNNAVAPVKNTTKQPAKKCPATSCDTGECCWSTIENTSGGPGPHPATQNVASMVDKSCGCPSDTTLSPDQGGTGLYKRCDCIPNR